MRGAVVLVFLRGGADSLFLVPPIGDDDYHRARPRLCASAREAIPLDGFFALHPALGDLAPLWRDGRLAIVPAAGSDDDTRSHFEAQDRVEQGGPRACGGWLGRWLRAGATGTGIPAVAMGEALPLSLRGAPGAVALGSAADLALPEPADLYRAQLAALDDGDTLLGGPAADTLRAVDRLRMATSDGGRDSAAGYGDDGFSAGLRELARLLRADVGVAGAALDLGGWDSHVAQETLLPPLARTLGRGLAAFARDLGPRLDHTSVVVMTEFGRRVRENSALGTDHGRASVMFVLGGGAPGGIAGGWPGLGDDVLEGPGDLRVAIDYRDVLLSVLARHGETDGVFPAHVPRPVAA